MDKQEIKDRIILSIDKATDSLEDLKPELEDIDYQHDDVRLLVMRVLIKLSDVGFELVHTSIELEDLLKQLYNYKE